MHIGIDGSRLSATATGTERYTFELLRHLGRLDSSRRYTIYTNGLPPTLPPLGRNFALRSIPYPRLWTHIRLSLEMQRFPPDILFIPAHVLPLLHPKRSIVTLHDIGYHYFPKAHTLARRLDLHLSTLWSAKAAWKLITVSHATKRDLMTRYGIAEEKLTVIYHGVSPSFQPVEDPKVIEEVQTRYGLREGQGKQPLPYFLYVGTIQPRKNLERLLEAFAQVAVKREVQLVLGGKKGWLTKAIEQKATELGIVGKVKFIGYVAEADLPALLSGALAFVFPSLYEGFGMPVLEAMACGVPVLTSTTSSLPEVAGNAALLVDPLSLQAIADGLERLFENAALRAKLQELGFLQAKSFTWERCAASTLDVLS